MNRLYLISKKNGYKGNIESTMYDGKVHYSSSLYNDNKGDLTLEEYNKRTGQDCIALTWGELYPLIQEYEKTLQKPFIEIPEEDFFEMFECLPPMRFTHHNYGFLFFMSEMTTGNLTQCYVKFKDKYFTALRSQFEKIDTIVNQVMVRQ